MEAASQAKKLKANRELGTLALDKHTPNYCNTLQNKLQVTWSEYKDWMKQLQYCKHHVNICYICHMPQINNDLHPTFTKAKKGGETHCVYADIIAPIAFTIYHDMGSKRRAEAQFEVNWGSSLTTFMQWLMGMLREKSYSNLVDLFLWYMETERL
ncbi:hypothetical protein JVT61DRAFT_23 [Boletus reticuloceps]|uniref:Uncharacterized protein n=1 Tax=Boletus reticuloceps TaxID=495285 RepID=A0A8I2YY29_9AGAM|nr:hypothetical protein JVT61DRAFT_23 [Boletus reticuloceps]